jgi:hypothetical protein
MQGVQDMKESRSITVSIFMAGSRATAIEVCRDYYKSFGGCVTVTPTTYVYTGGQEQGFVVGFINYPPYPDGNEDSLILKAMALAEVLARELGQQSYTIQGPTRTMTWGRD